MTISCHGSLMVFGWVSVGFNPNNWTKSFLVYNITCDSTQSSIIRSSLLKDSSSSFSTFRISILSTTTLIPRYTSNDTVFDRVYLHLSLLFILYSTDPVETDGLFPDPEKRYPLPHGNFLIFVRPLY